MDALSPTHGLADGVTPPRRSVWWLLEDLGDERVRVVHRERGQDRVAYLGSAEGPEWDRLAAEARAAQDAGKAWVAAILPGAVTLWRVLEAPELAKARRPDVLANLLDVQLPFAVEEAVYAFLDPGSGPVTAVACRRTDLADRQAAWAAWDPAWWWPEGVVLRRVAGDDGALRLAGRRATLGWTEAGGWRVQTLPLAETADVPARITKAVQALVDAPSVWKVVAEDAALVRTWSDTDRDWQATPEVQFAAEAFAGAAAGDLPCFRTAVDPHPAVYRSALRGAARGPWMLAGTGLLLLALSIWMHLHNGRVARENETRVQQLAQDISGMRQVPRGQELLVVQRQLDDRQPTDRLVRAVVEGGGWEQVAPLLDWCRTRGMTLGVLEWSIDAVRVAGTAASWDTVESLQARFTDQGFDVEIRRTSADGQVPVTFQLQGVRP